MKVVPSAIAGVLPASEPRFSTGCCLRRSAWPGNVSSRGTVLATEVTPASVPLRTERRSLLWGMRWIAVAVGFSYVIRLLRGGVLPKLLPPDRYGLAMSLLLPLTYLRYADLGVLDQLGKRLPFLRASEGEEKFRQHLNLGAAWTLGTSVLAAFGVIVASFWLGGAITAYYRVGLRLVAAILVAQRFRFLLLVQLNAREEFHHSQIGSMLSEGATFVYSVVGVILWGPIGLIWAMLFSEITGSLYLVTKASLPRLAYALGPMVAMVREGILLLGVALTELFLQTVDQMFLLKFFPVAEYGLYVLGIAYLSFFESPRALFDAAAPRVMGLTGAGKSAEAKSVTSSTLVLYGLVLALALCGGVPCAAAALRFYLTRYQAAMGLYLFMPVMSIARGPVALLRTYYLSRNWERRLILYEGAGLVTMVVLDSLTVAFKLGLVGIAAATACGYALTSVLLLRGFEGSVGALVRHFKQYSLYLGAAIGAGCFYEFWLLRSAGAQGRINLAPLFWATLVYGLFISTVIYFARTEWLSAIRTVRAQPHSQEKEISYVLSEVAE
jgi:hypothetical protein